MPDSGLALAGASPVYPTLLTVFSTEITVRLVGGGCKRLLVAPAVPGA